MVYSLTESPSLIKGKLKVLKNLKVIAGCRFFRVFFGSMIKLRNCGLNYGLFFNLYGLIYGFSPNFTVFIQKP